VETIGGKPSSNTNGINVETAAISAIKKKEMKRYEKNSV